MDKLRASLERESGLRQCLARERAARETISSQRAVRGENADVLYEESLKRENELLETMSGERALRAAVDDERGARAHAKLGSLLAPVEQESEKEKRAEAASVESRQAGFATALRAAKDALTVADRTILELQREKGQLIESCSEARQQHGADQLALNQAWKEIECLRTERDRMRGQGCCYRHNKNDELVRGTIENPPTHSPLQSPLQVKLAESGQFLKAQMEIRDSMHKFKDAMR